jgi:hypothetical protein
MDRTEALADALRAAAADADSIHHDLCPGALIEEERDGPCSCGIPALVRALAALAVRRPPAVRRPAGRPGGGRRAELGG